MVDSSRLIAAGIQPDSIAGELDIERGDKIEKINDKPVYDIIDYYNFCAGEFLKLEILKKSGRRWILEIEKDADEDLGIIFKEDIPGGVRKCRNNCIFCFADQLPPGMRESLYVKDDDYRYSFLYGNYISLTNLSGTDWERIKRLRLSPLFVSVHTTNARLRQKIFNNYEAGKIMSQLQELADTGITIHTQIVVCPGINDGQELVKTLRDLGSLWPSVRSVAVVPVGVTKYQRYEYPFYPVGEAEAGKVIELTEKFQKEFKPAAGTSFAFLSDEFYLAAGEEIPKFEHYEDFPQIENGVGLIRLFLEELDEELEYLPKKIAPAKKVLAVTGYAAKEIIEQAARKASREVEGFDMHVLPVENEFFGSTVNVSGLLTGRDISRAVNNYFDRSDLDKEKTEVLIPSTALKPGQDIFLDDISLAELERYTGVEINAVEETAKGLILGAIGREVFVDEAHGCNCGTS